MKTETWLAFNDGDELVICAICPTGYEFYSGPRVLRSGGDGMLDKKITLKRQKLITITLLTVFEGSAGQACDEEWF